jgi:hypothetical protein
MNQIIKTFMTLGLVLSIVTSSCKKDAFPGNETATTSQQNDALVFDKLSNKVIIDWSNTSFEAAGGALEGHPLLASRIEAMMHIAMHDALNSIVPVYQHYTFHSQQHGANPFAAAASAAHTVLKASWPDAASMLDAKLSESLATIPDGPSKTKGIALGIESGNAILALRANDGAYQYPLSAWPSSGAPGVYVTVPPSDSVYGVFWGEMQTFSLQTQSQFRPPPPPDLNSYIYTRDFNEVKRLGKINSALRTEDQTAYANFWYELADIGWNKIARTEAMNHKTGLYTTARMFALLNMAMADGYTAGWNAKYYYKFWRPYTAIHEAATDGNNLTKADLNWEPLQPTPPIPDYPSGHATEGNAAATVLTYFYGNTPFSATSNTALPIGTTRSFESFKQAADENADSRVMIGFHFRSACEAGQKLGDNVAKWTVDHYLKPLH